MLHEAVLADPAVLDHREGHQRQRGRHGDVAGRGGHARHESQQVAGQDEEERRQQVAHEPVGARSDRLPRDLVADEHDQHFQGVAQSAWNRVPGPACRQAEEQQQDRAGDPHHHDVLGDRQVETGDVELRQRDLERGDEDLELVGVEDVVQDVPADVDRLLGVGRRVRMLCGLGSAHVSAHP